MSYAEISEDDNVGSLRAIDMALARNLSSVNPVTFNAGYDWLEIDFLPESGRLQDGSRDTPQGTEYNYAATFVFNKQNVALYNAFKPFIGILGVVQVTDSNGLVRILGTPKNPVTIAHDADTGTGYSSLNFYKVKITWDSHVPAVVVAP